MDRRALYGTDEPAPEARVITQDALTTTLEAGNLRHIRLGGVELIRAIAFLVRDRDWGTLAPQITGLSITAGDATLIRYDAGYQAGAARLDVAVTIRITAAALEFEAVARATGDFETNRAGFTVLHPITGVAGQPLRVTHSGGAEEHTHFPERIAPWQPFKDITALTHRTRGVEVECRFEGDTFEMEDQRQWGDASYKTYVRPLALPWPYLLPDGSVTRQAVRLAWRTVEAATPVTAKPPQPTAPFPETALVLTTDDARRAIREPESLAAIAPQRLLCHFDATAGHGAAELAAFAALQAAHPGIAFDLELIAACPPGADTAHEFAAHAAALAASGLDPDSIMVCPSVDRQSTPPGSDWPACPPLDDIHRAARAAFPGRLMGGGMASFFPELNRKRPPVALLDFVTHGFCPIIHAADDLSVMETLETVPHITASARTIIGTGSAYRIGPATIALRQNPYGSRTIPNPGRGRVCMSDDDPRQDGAFAAAWTLGLATALAPAGAAVWTPAALYGPRGLYRDDGSARPLAAVVAALACHAGEDARATLDHRSARLSFPTAEYHANLTAEAAPDTALGPFEWRAFPSKRLQDTAPARMR